ncbi:zinc ribbon domain-containing protein [bacterium]|nr:zinc ribbon domain-containing protein [candidate division CSSED10-310 bacterium]
MPTYEYECSQCGHVFEKFQKMSDVPLRDCPLCGGRVRRLIGTGSGIIFKGSGFYATDHGRSTTPQGKGLGARCDRDHPCCGLNTPCDHSPKRS